MHVLSESIEKVVFLPSLKSKGEASKKTVFFEKLNFAGKAALCCNVL